MEGKNGLLGKRSAEAIVPALKRQKVEKVGLNGAAKRTKAFACPHEQCELVFNKLSRLQKHLQSHSPDADEGLVSTELHAFEAEAHTKEATSYACLQCDRTFRKRKQLRSHVDEIHPSNSLICDVEGCGKIFESQAALAKHQKVHDEFRYSCTHADCEGFIDDPRRFETWSALQQHLKEEHAPSCGLTKPSSSSSPTTHPSLASERHPCTQPGCTFKGRKMVLLARHLAKAHGIADDDELFTLAIDELTM